LSTKNWPNDYRIGCKSPFTLVELIEINVNVEELKEFQIAFERDEIVKL
jgi:hypothetical protein